MEKKTVLVLEYCQKFTRSKNENWRFTDAVSEPFGLLSLEKKGKYIY